MCCLSCLGWKCSHPSGRGGEGPGELHRNFMVSTTAQKGCRVPVLGDIQKTFGYRPGQLALANPAWAGIGLDNLCMSHPTSVLLLVFDESGLSHLEISDCGLEITSHRCHWSEGTMWAQKYWNTAGQRSAVSSNIVHALANNWSMTAQGPASCCHLLG